MKRLDIARNNDTGKVDSQNYGKLNHFVKTIQMKCNIKRISNH